MFKKLLICLVISFNLINISYADFDIKARSAILQDYHSGEILYEKDADRIIFPASMTKIMTSIIAFDLIQNGELNLNDKSNKSLSLNSLKSNSSTTSTYSSVVEILSCIVNIGASGYSIEIRLAITFIIK